MAKQRISDEKAKKLAVKAGLNPDDVDQVWGRGDRRQVEIFVKGDGLYTLSRQGDVNCLREPKKQ
ncbi:hypothetical protein [Rhizobium leguminosarum]|uniref:hypothetical protein n=1 Tax=Rhizobium leguminosarum TaxID=384 RepID=UPI001C8FDA62|nr:hypothetical protein [Rhizobium leguminosarum]MBY2986378.1 hypothetical protein [Rhizobium leguminosarum]